MIRNLKMLMLAAFALLAFGALTASAAQAITGISKPAESTRVTVTPDGSSGSTTAHQVFDAAGASITCPTVSGEATLGGSETSYTHMVLENIVYNGQCKFAGQNAYVFMNGCKYTFNTVAGVIQTTIFGCETGKKIEFGTVVPACLVTVGQQGPLNSLTAHNPNGNEITVEAHVANITYQVDGPMCPVGTGTYSNGNYTTGNFLLTGERDVAGGAMVPIQANNPDPTP